MALHLVKLCVGCDTIGDLETWIVERARRNKSEAAKGRHVHITRMVPKRIEDLLAGGSLYWVIRGTIACRQQLIAVEPFRDKDGIGRCRLVMMPKVVAVAPRPMRAFQGWRYLAPEDAPPDLAQRGKGLLEMPETMRRELESLGLL